MFACCIKQIGAQQCRKRVSQVESIQGLGGLGFFLATKQKEARSNREIWLVLRTQTCSFIHFGFRTKKMARLRASLQSESQSSLGNSVRSWLRLRSQQRPEVYLRGWALAYHLSGPIQFPVRFKRTFARLCWLPKGGLTSSVGWKGGEVGQEKEREGYLGWYENGKKNLS